MFHLTLNTEVEFGWQNINTFIQSLTIYKNYNYIVKLNVLKTEKGHADIESLSIGKLTYMEALWYDDEKHLSSIQNNFGFPY